MRTAFALPAIGLAVLATTVVAPAPALAAAPGCPSTHPTSITGNIYGGGDNYSVGVLVGMDFLDASGQRVDYNGVPKTSTYGYVDNVNPSLTALGSSDTTSYERRYGANGSDAPLCVSGVITKAYFELYPKTNGVTDKRRYGSAAEQGFTVTPGVANVLKDLRPPLRSDVDTRGNTGAVNGYVTYNGGRLPTTSDWKVKVWPVPNSGPGCGIHGFAASSDVVSGYSDNTATAIDESRLPVASSGTSNYYVVDALAGGQCGATSQEYRLDLYRDNVTLIRKTIYVSKGTRPRVDIAV